MTVSVYYNDSDRFCCEWLRNLMGAARGLRDRPVARGRGGLVARVP